jgi:hypothetical protein
MGQTVLFTEDRPDVSIPCPRVCRFWWCSLQYSHAHMLLTHVVSSPTLDINYYWFGYYLPNSYHMHFTDYYFTAVKITNTQSSRIPELHHTFKYINCSTSMYFASSNIDLDCLLAFSLSHSPLSLSYLTLVN